MNKKVLECFICFYLYKFRTFFRCDFLKDNLAYIMKESLEYLNDYYNDYFLLSIDENNKFIFENININHFSSLDNDLIHLISILELEYIDKEEIIAYIEVNFNSEYKQKVKNFFSIITGKYDLSGPEIVQEIENYDNILIKNLLLFFFNGVVLLEIEKSISYLDELIDKYPYFISFYLLRIRQNFNLVYRNKFGENNFNKAITTAKGKEEILNHQLIKFCIKDFENCEKYNPNHPVIYLFKGKFFLQLLNEEGLDLLQKYLYLEKKAYDQEIFSWIGIYYLQIGDYLKAKSFIEKIHYDKYNRYRAYSKLLYLYILNGEIETFLNLFETKFKSVKIIIRKENKFFEFVDGLFEEKRDFTDKFDLEDKMSFTIKNIDILISNRHKSRKDCLEFIYKNISKSYYEHWHLKGKDKVFFYSDDNFNYGIL